MNVYHRKLYALVRSLETINWLGTDVSYIYNGLSCLAPHLEELQTWWENGNIGTSISSSSDRVNLNSTVQPGQMDNIVVRHPISGQEQTITVSAFNQPIDISRIAAESDEKIVFWWFWRYFPKQLAHLDPENALLIPTHRILPDCPLHSYQSTVSALTGAIFPDGEGLSFSKEKEAPYLLLFTFSPVQEFIKSSRKFLDFWAGSFLLHYFSALLCFEAAKLYGPDAVITPSLWNQEIIDAFIIQEYPEFRNFSQNSQQPDNDPTTKFDNDPQYQSLSTAGFPNVITILVPNQKSATELGKYLDKFLKMRWLEMSQKVRGCIKCQVINLLDKENQIEEIWNQISEEFPNSEASDLNQELRQFRQKGCWEWNKLWDAQIENTWETYFVSIPFGHPTKPLEIDRTNLDENQLQEWIRLQNQIARPIIDLPSQAELQAYTQLNVGSLWGSLQARLGNTIQAIKNTRAWQIPVAPGERSTLSGQYSAVHPRFVYQQFPNGFGMPSESLRLFWRVMGLAFPGLFNGSEKLNAIELTKRMAWKHGGVAESLGIPLNDNDDDYEKLIRFPNLSSIAAAHFATHHPERIERYWNDLRGEISKELNSKYHIFCSRTRRPFQVKRADAALRERTNYENGYNGVMFSSKWLADDMNLNRTETNALRTVIDKVQKDHFGDSTPADWWVLVLGDGDGMGNYVNGRKLKFYQDYLVSNLLDTSNIQDQDLRELLNTRKRMGPATHIGLNRALLDFSNRLVPYITEQRFCGRVIYSGGDDVMAALPLADLPQFLRSLRAAWCGAKDPEGEFINRGGYWQWDTQNSNKKPNSGDIPARPLFTMGEEATMSLGIVIAHKSVPLPTVLEKLWDAEKEGAKKLIGGVIIDRNNPEQEKRIPDKDGLCFRVIYGSGNTLEAFMKGHLLEGWWNFIQISQQYETLDLTPVLYRLAEELPRHAEITADDRLFQKVAEVVLSSRNEELPQRVEDALLNWLDAWEEWAWSANQTANQRQTQALGSKPEDIAMLLRFTAFWVSKQII